MSAVEPGTSGGATGPAAPGGTAAPDAELQTGDVVVVDVGPVAHGGHFVARHEGRVLFVRHTAPGERVRARITGAGPGGRFLYADAVEIEQAAPERVVPPCPYAGTCGGCDFQHLSLAAQRDLKATVVREQFSRLAGLEVDVEVAELGEPEPGLRWRSRVEFAVDPDGRPGLRPHRSHEVLPIADCLIAARPVVETGVLQQDWPGLVAVDVAAPSVGSPVVTEVGPQGPEQENPALLTERVRATWVLPSGDERVFEHSFEVAARGFWQVHPAAAPTFLARVMAELDPQPGERALDLYAGVGLFAAALADAVGPTGQVIAVESDPMATISTRENLGSWPHALVMPGRVDDAFGVARPARRGPAGKRATRDRKPKRSPLMPQTADLVVLDPPRTGAGASVVRAIAALRPRAVAYVACDPAALARDTATFAEAGYALSGLTAYDAFPMTHHIECIATFTRSGADLR